MTQHFTYTTAMPSVDVNYQTERGELMASVSIEKIISCRQHVLAKVSAAVELLKEAEKYSTEIGGGIVKDWDTKNGIYTSLFAAHKDDVLVRVKKVNDHHIWTDLMKKSGMLSLMDDQARTEWDTHLERGEYPEITHDNILASFEQLNHEKEAVFERGVINLFKSLSWDYKTNNPCRFGAKIIMNYFVEYSASWGFSSCYSANNKLNDLERILSLLDGKSATDHRNSISGQLSDHIRANPSDAAVFVDEYFSIRYFKKRSGHLTFTCPTLIEKLNDILSRHYPNALPPKV